MDFKESFKNKLKLQREGLEVNSNSLSFFEEISKEYEQEIDSNPILKFKKELLETSKTIKEKILEEKEFNVFFSEDFQKPVHEEIFRKELVQEEIIEEVLFDEVIEHNIPQMDLISVSINSITKEEKNKPVKEHTDLFNQPNSKKSDPSIKVLQDKLKFLEDWVSKISMASPGSGEVNLRWLDDVDRSTISDGRYLRYNESSKKFEFYTIYNTTTVTTNEYFVKETDYYVGVNFTGNASIILPNSAPVGTNLVVKDESSNCANNPIHISGNIDNDSSGVILRIDNGALNFIYNNGWRII